VIFSTRNGILRRAGKSPMLPSTVVKRNAERSTFLLADRRLVVRDLFTYANFAFAQDGPAGEPPRVVAVRVVTESGSVLEQDPPS